MEFRDRAINFYKNTLIVQKKSDPERVNLFTLVIFMKVDNI